MNFAHVLASRMAARSSSLHTLDQADERASIASSRGTCASNSTSSSLESSSLSHSLETRSCVSEPACSSGTRQNEHLAVLLSEHLWKPDAQASHCDIFLCRKKFSFWERKHHCRKCGGVVCGDCSARTTALLDTSNLGFIHPPRDTPISVFASPISPVVPSRVCDHCWDQIHGVRTPRSPVIKVATPITVLKDGLRDPDSSASSSVVSSLSTPLDGSPVVRPSSRRAHTTSPRLPASPLRSPVSSSQALAVVHVSDTELSSDLGELEAYPLRRASVICKATGGGRWEPKQPINLIGHQIPGAKATYEIELELEEAERKRRKENPVFRDGDFQLRVPRELEPRSPAGPIQFSTF